MSERKELAADLEAAFESNEVADAFINVFSPEKMIIDGNVNLIALAEFLTARGWRKGTGGE